MNTRLFLFLCVICSGLLYNVPLSAQSPKPPSAKKIKKQADADFKLQKYMEAIVGYTKANELKPNNYKVLYNRACSYERTKQLSSAISDYEACSKLKPKEKALYLTTANLYMKQGTFRPANVVLEQLLLIDKKHLEGLQKSAWCHIMLREFDQATAKADRAIAIESHTDGQTTEISHYYRGLARDSLKDYNGAIASYKRAITILKAREVNRVKIKPQYEPYYVNLAVAQYKVKAYDDALKTYETALAIDLADTVAPENYYIYYLRSFSFLAKSDYNSAIGDLNRAIVMNPKSAMLFFQRGLVYKQTSQFQSAISDFTKTNLIDESNAIAYFYKAQCEVELANYKDAISDLKHCVKLRPWDLEASALLKNAEEKYYNANRESDPPVIRWGYPFIDQNNFINVYVNQLNVIIEGEVTDKSFIKSITVNRVPVKYNAEDLNPVFKCRLPLDQLTKIDLVVTDIYNNSTSKTVKVGKIASETRVIANLEGIILSADSTGQPLANKTIYLTNHKGEQFYAGKTDAQGHFKFENLPVDKDYLIDLDDADVSLHKKGFVLADKNGKVIMRSIASADNKNKFAFELLQTDMATLSLMTMDDVSMTISIGGKLLGYTSSQFPLPNINLQLVKANGEVLTQKTNESGYFNFVSLDPGSNYSFRIDENEARSINASKIIITDHKGQVVKVISRNEQGFFEYKMLETDKSQLASITEPDPWLKITTLNKDKKELAIIENIYYESGSFMVPKNSEPILDKAVAALKSNPKLTLEVESHTDAIASDEYNMELSQKRAAKVVEYIEAKGIDKKRLIPRGMGETALTNHCANGVDCSDAEHKQNRRTIFRLVYN